MSRTTTLLAAISFAALAMTAPAAAQDAPADLTVLQPIPADYAPPRTSWGDPDLRGMWPIDNIASIPMQRPAQFGDRFYLTDEEYAARQQQASGSDERYAAEDEAGTIGFGHWVESDVSGRRTSLLVSPANGQLPPMTEWAQRYMAPGVSRTSWTPNTQFDWVSDFDSWDRCVSRGFPASMFPFRYNNGIEVMQSPGFVVINLEMIHDARIVPIVANRAAAEARRWPAGVEAWMGQPIGWWEGNTLVIETSNIKSGNSAEEDTALRNASPLNMATMGVPPFNVIPTGPQARAVERLTMTGPDSIVYEITYTDPQVFTAPWTARLDWTRNDEYQFFEYACHEGNVQVRNYISASQAGVELSGESGGLE
ncbi:hypothetical protein GRI62_08675 [Erythrobacter arachoides]|uniref:Uncharacterized protein n=1 Tax=Aurantiacibacter arachoides TaxID=1850444 RepID=A0A845A805_9SPHN|nr:hypothetical protein [Aurantiacibacter arachoides]MXO93679.1 hypothetical protein [Aurantiacibacter arachoides]GGD47472.1 hypothetical protein GCM10011411_04030 [Aurantiacibacter arachoides]